eukprot:TRINITY_DN8523_c0_g1_i1.p1 TRINITY_DN8523_c0_g1~~TRINITY_DN8523_c0_g1_i1.p1  ORF type:complete len:213 (+),score=31.23 TRINITY_DN8523_c0_g1_i1:402-1040(+)
MVLALSAVLAALAVVAWILYKLDAQHKLVRLITGLASDRTDVYCWAALIGSLALIGLAASCWQMYMWYQLGESPASIDCESCCCGCQWIQCRYWSVWDWYMMSNMCETCMRSGRHGIGRIGGGRDDLPVVAVILFVAVAIFTVIGIFVGFYFATALGQYIFQRHSGLLLRRVLTKEYVVEDLDGLEIRTLPPCDTQVDENDLELIRSRRGRT